MHHYYTPKTGWLADVIPFFQGGSCYLCYLNEIRICGLNGEDTPCYLPKTMNFVFFEELGEVVLDTAWQHQMMAS